MRRLTRIALALVLAAGVCGAGAVAAAEGPTVVVLEGKVTELEFSGSEAAQKTALSTLGGKEIKGEGDTATVSECVTLEAKEKDSNLCRHGRHTFLRLKQGAVACRSENEKGEKDPIETVLTNEDVHLASEKSTGGVLQPLAILEVLGIAGEKELTVNCGAVKEKVKGKIGCLVLPGLKEVATTESVEVLCKTKSAGDQESGTCEETKVLCEELAKNPLEANLGAGFEMAALTGQLKLKANKNIFIDD